MQEAITTGEVENMQSKQAKNGGTYTAIILKGKKKSFYDWDGHCELAGIALGDTVKIEHDGSEFPRVTGLEKLGASKSTGTSGNESEESKDGAETRMCALVCAALVLHGSNPPEEEITSLAEHLERWITG